MSRQAHCNAWVAARQPAGPTRRRSSRSHSTAGYVPREGEATDWSGEPEGRDAVRPHYLNHPTARTSRHGPTRRCGWRSGPRPLMFRVSVGSWRIVMADGTTPVVPEVPAEALTPTG